MSLSSMAGIARTVIVLLCIFLLIVGVATYFDLASYTAANHEMLTPDGAAKGKALIVYDPGIMGTGAKSARWMGSDLRTRGYRADVAGIRSEGIENATTADIVIVISPTYYGGLTSPVKAYLQNVTLKQDAIVGVYSITGLAGDDASGEMKAALSNRSVAVKSAGTVSAWDGNMEEKSYAFVYGLLR